MSLLERMPHWIAVSDTRKRFLRAMSHAGYDTGSWDEQEAVLRKYGGLRDGEDVEIRHLRGAAYALERAGAQRELIF